MKFKTFQQFMDSRKWVWNLHTYYNGNYCEPGASGWVFLSDGSRGTGLYIEDVNTWSEYPLTGPIWKGRWYTQIILSSFRSDSLEEVARHLYKWACYECFDWGEVSSGLTPEKQLCHYIVDEWGDETAALARLLDVDCRTAWKLITEKDNPVIPGIREKAGVKPGSLLDACMNVLQIMRATYGTDEETGEVDWDEPGDASGADIVEMLCGIEGLVSDAVSNALLSDS